MIVIDHYFSCPAMLLAHEAFNDNLRRSKDRPNHDTGHESIMSARSKKSGTAWKGKGLNDPPNHRAIVRWHLAYTLVRNRDLTEYRKRAINNTLVERQIEERRGKSFI